MFCVLYLWFEEAVQELPPMPQGSYATVNTDHRQIADLYCVLAIPYSRVIRRISPISAYPLLSGGFCS